MDAGHLSWRRRRSQHELFDMRTSFQYCGSSTFMAALTFFSVLLNSKVYFRIGKAETSYSFQPFVMWCIKISHAKGTKTNKNRSHSALPPRGNEHTGAVKLYYKCSCV